MSDWFFVWLITVGFGWFLLDESWWIYRESERQRREALDALRATVNDFYALRDIHNAYREAAIQHIAELEFQREAEGEGWKN